MSKILWLFGFALLGTGAHASSSKDAPSWLQEISSRATPAYPGKTPAAVLFEEQRVTVDPSGMVTTTARKAIKVLTREGQHYAGAEEYYFAGGRRVKQLHAWLITPNGFVKTFDKNSIADIGAFGDMELYSDIRIRRIQAETPEIGAVFGYESEVEEKALFAQDEYSFQTNLPAIQSRYVLTLPSGWTPTGVVFNHAPIQPVVDGSTYTWELKDLPFREQEEHAPALRGLAPRLAVDFRASAATPALISTRFQSWKDVSRWHSALSAGQDQPTPELSTKVIELTANAHSEYQKIEAIARYVQAIRYVAIEMDEAHGGGYKPHAAASVFHKQYGDCKDKANLMRAMLKVAGIQSYLVAISAEDRTFVRAEWPSPAQFNHMILAIHVSDATVAPTIITTQALGPLLIFDATSETTPLGDLPWKEQGSFALLCAGDRGDLTRMPVMKVEANSIEVSVDAELTLAGDLQASFTSTRKGQPADAARAERLYRNSDDYRRHFEQALSRTAKAPAISSFEANDNFAGNTFQTKVAFISHNYAQLMQQRLLVFSPSIVEPAAPIFPANVRRTEPIVLRAQLYRKQVRLKLPAGFSVDEVPEAATGDSSFGHFSLRFQQQAGELIMDEDLTTEAVILPAEQYGEVKAFFDKFSGADQQRAVLIKN